MKSSGRSILPNFLRKRPSLLSAIVLLSVITNLVFLITQLGIRWRHGGGTYTYVGHSHPRSLISFVPTSEIRTTFKEDRVPTILNATSGLVYLDAKKQRLPYTVSFVHALRCVEVLRSALTYGDINHVIQDNGEQLAGRGTSASTTNTGVLDETATKLEVERCFAYLRQSLLCSGDVTLVDESKPEEHKCADSKGIMSWIEGEQRKWSPEMWDRAIDVSRGYTWRGGSGL